MRYARECERVSAGGRADQVRIFRNYIHHNQHPRSIGDNHTAGNGVDVHHGAWAQVYENVFDYNRHAIAAAGDTGGYEAVRNLVLAPTSLNYFDLEDRVSLARLAEPMTALAGLRGLVVIDEVQRMPGLIAVLRVRALNRHWLRGGFPRAYLARSNADSVTWRRQFVQTFLERDIPLLGIRIPVPALVRFWSMLAHYHANVWNAAEPARSQ